MRRFVKSAGGILQGILEGLAGRPFAVINPPGPWGQCTQKGLCPALRIVSLYRVYIGSISYLYRVYIASISPPFQSEASFLMLPPPCRTLAADRAAALEQRHREPPPGSWTTLPNSQIAPPDFPFPSSLLTSHFLLFTSHLSLLFPPPILIYRNRSSPGCSLAGLRLRPPPAPWSFPGQRSPGDGSCSHSDP